MNKIKQAINNIKLSDHDKNKIINNIIEEKKKKHSLFNFNSVIRFATIVIAIGLFSYTSVYAAAKIFNWDNKFLDFLGISSNEAEKNNLKNTIIEKTIKIDNMNITVNQAAIFGDTIYVLLSYEFDSLEPNITIEDLNTDKIDLTIENEDNIYRGAHTFISFDPDLKKAVAVSELNIDTPLTTEQVKINFHTDYIFEQTSDDGAGTGWFQTTDSMEIELDIEKNKEYIISEFDEKLYLKNTELIKLQPTKLSINPVSISIEMNLFTNIESLEDEDLKFDNTINIKFKDGSVIELDGIAKDGKHIEGTNIIGGYIDELGNEIKQMTFTYSNIYSFGIYSKPDFNFINIDDITSIEIGNTTIKK